MNDPVEPWELRFRTGYLDGEQQRRAAGRLETSEYLIVALGLRRSISAGEAAVAVGVSEVCILKRFARFGLNRPRGKPKKDQAFPPSR